MTDITPIQPAGAPGRPDPAQGTHPRPQGASFDEVLRAARGERAGSAGSPSGAPGVTAPPAPYLGPIEPPQAGPNSVAGLSERFFQLAERYQTQLADPNASLRDIAPLVRDLESHRDQLAEQLNTLPAGDPGRGLLEEMAALISSESVKFHRGDYV